MWTMGESSTMGTLQKVPSKVYIKELRARFEKAWSRDTCWHKAVFHPKVPSGGQCFVTAMVVQDIFGGDIIQGTVRQIDGKMNHYWNRFPNGQEFDFTSDQFVEGDGIHRHPFAVKSNKFASPNRKSKRYLLLKNRIVET
jgi:hypothetical protein